MSSVLFPSSTQRILILIIAHKWEYLSGTQESNGGVTRYHWSKEKKICRTEIGHIEKGKRKMPTSPVTSSSTAPCQERDAWPVISPAEESENMWVSAQLPQLGVKLLRTPTPFSPLSEYRGDLHTWGARRGGEHSSQGSEFNRGHSPTNHFADSIRKPTRESLGTPPVGPPMLAQNHNLGPPTCCIPHSHTDPPYVCPWGQCVRPLWTFSMGRKLAHPAGLGERIHTWAALNYPRKSKQETQHSAWLYGIRRGIQS